MRSAPSKLLHHHLTRASPRMCTNPVMHPLRFVLYYDQNLRSILKTDRILTQSPTLCTGSWTFMLPHIDRISTQNLPVTAIECIRDPVSSTPPRMSACDGVPRFKCIDSCSLSHSLALEWWLDNKFGCIPIVTSKPRRTEGATSRSMLSTDMMTRLDKMLALEIQISCSTNCEEQES